MEELQLYEGRPADCTGRLEKEVRTYDLLDKLGIQFWRTDHGWMKAIPWRTATSSTPA